jgi:hypothetical protein
VALRFGGRLSGTGDPAPESEPLSPAPGALVPGPAPAELGVFGQVAGGLLMGAHDEALTGWAMNQLADILPGTSREDLDLLDQQVRMSPAGDIFRTIGYFSTLFAQGGIIGGIGRNVGKAALGAVAPRLMAGGGVLAGQAERFLTRQAAEAGLSGGAAAAAEAVPSLAANASKAAVGKVISKGALERGAEIGGQAAAFGGASATGAALNPEAMGGEDPLTAGLMGAGLSAGADLVFAGLGNAIRPGGPVSRAVQGEPLKAILKSFKPPDAEAAIRNVRKVRAKPEFQGRVGQYVADHTERLHSWADEVGKAVGMPNAEMELLKQGDYRRIVPALERKLAGNIRITNRRSRGKIERGLQKTRRETHHLNVMDDFLRDLGPKANILRETPLVPSERGLSAQKFLLGFLKSPEVMAREMGPGTGSKLAQTLQRAEVDKLIGQYHVGAKVADMRQRAAQITGLRGAKLNETMWGYIDEYERTGDLAAIKAIADARGHHGMEAIVKAGDDLVDKLLQGDPGLGTKGQGLVALGVDRAFSKDDLAKAGVSRLWPKVVDRARVMDRKYRKSLLKEAEKKGMSKEEAQQAVDILINEESGTLQKMARLDANREFHGTYKDALARGVPLVDDPFVALAKFGTEANHKLAYIRHFGTDRFDNLAKTIPGMVEAEGGSKALAIHLTKEIFRKRTHDSLMGHWMQAITDGQMASKLAFAVIPNATQSFNSALALGTGNLIRGITNSIRGTGATDYDLMLAAALGESVNLAGREAFLETGRKTTIGWLADGVLKGSGFTFVEKWNRMFGGATAEVSVVRSLGQAAEGRLRGRNLEATRRTLGQLDIDLDRVVGDIRSSGGMAKWMSDPQRSGPILRRAAFNGMRLTQFVQPDFSKMPLYWRHPAGRVAFQFKTYALNQTRFLRDQVLMEAANGNYRPLAMYVGVAPVLGDAVGDLRAWLKGKPEPKDDSGIKGYVDDIAALGGFGMMSDVAMSIGNRRFLEWAVGPTGSDIGKMAEIIVANDRAKAVTKFVGGLPLSQALMRLWGGAKEGTEWTTEHVHAIMGGDGNQPESMSQADFYKLQKQSQE